VEAEFAHEFIRRGGNFAYWPIIASGKNACVLHYIQKISLAAKATFCCLTSREPRQLQFRPEPNHPDQRAFLASSARGVRCGAAGAARLQPSGHARQTAPAMAKGGRSLHAAGTAGSWVTQSRSNPKAGPRATSAEKILHARRGHPIGLDVHDLGLTTEPIESAGCSPSNPGIYLPEEGFAVRLENDILVQEGGNIDLMADIPIEAGDIESLMKRASK